MTLLSLPTDELQEAIPTPLELQDELPLNSSTPAFIEKARAQIRAVLNSRDPRLLLIVGPCSIHDLKAAYNYAEKLKRVAHEVSEHLLIVMRTYFEKPRTMRGWKGLLFDPHLDGSYDMAAGLRQARRLLLDLAEMELPAGTELLEINTTHYLSDLLSWGCIGARTSTSQPHRQLASSVPLPVGFKNTTDGNIENAIHGVLAARDPHTFLGLLPHGEMSRIQSTGNPDCHLILRGGSHGPNYDVLSVAKTVRRCQETGINPRLVIDCSHDNCGKEHQKQVAVFHSLLHQITEDQQPIVGLMLESHLQEGTQPLTDTLDYGISITDPCLDWNTTERLIYQAAEKLSLAFRE